MLVESEYLILLDGKEVSVDLIGRCWRGATGIECEVEKVMFQGENRIGDVPQDHMRYMQQRLWHAHLSARHPLGEPEAAV